MEADASNSLQILSLRVPHAFSGLYNGNVQPVCLHYQRFSPEHDRVIVLLHGLTGNIGRWKDYLPELQKEHSILAIDLIGHGDSGDSQHLSDYSIDAQLEQIVVIFRQECIAHCTVVGHSYSCALALRLVELTDVHVDRLVLISPYFPDENIIYRMRRLLLRMIILLWKFLPDQKGVRRFTYVAGRTSAHFSDNVRAIKEIGIKTYLAHLRNVFIDSLRLYVPGKIDIPVLMVHREQDSLCLPTVCVFLRTCCTSLVESLLPGNGHLYLRQSSDEILMKIRNFLRS